MGEDGEYGVDTIVGGFKRTEVRTVRNNGITTDYLRSFLPLVLIKKRVLTTWFLSLLTMSQNYYRLKYFKSTSVKLFLTPP